MEENPLLPTIVPEPNSTSALSNVAPSSTATNLQAESSTANKTVVTPTSPAPLAVSPQATPFSQPSSTTTPSNCDALFTQPVVAATPLFLETNDQVCLKTEQARLVIAKSSWKLSLAENTSGKNIWEEPLSTGAKTGNADLEAYGTPSFLVNKQLVNPPKAKLYADLPDQIWFHLTKIISVNWQTATRVLNITAETNDPSGRTANFKVTSANTDGSILSFNMELSDNQAVTSTGISSLIASDEHFFGLGQRQLKMDQRGQRAVQIVRRGLELDPKNGTGSYAPYPFVLSTKGYGLLAQTQRRNVFDMGATRPDATLLVVDAANLNVIFFVNKNPLTVLELYTGLIGRPPLPPPWDFGVWKNSIGGQEQVAAEAKRLRDNQIPVSVLWIYDAVDPQSATGWDTQVFTPIPIGNYPNLASLNHTLHDLGYKSLSYVQESVQTNWISRYKEGVANDYFVHNSKGQTYLLPFNRYGVSMLDFTNQAAVKWFQDGLKRILVDLDFDGALQDTGDILPFDAQLSNGQTGYAMANIYPVLYAKAAYDAAQKYKPDAVFLMRSGYMGSQQYQKATWEGDLINHWDWRAGLPSTLPAALNRSISGSPFIGTEIAGYLGVSLPYSDRHELYLRWTQYGAFNPIMRDVLGQQPADTVYLWSDNETVSNFKRYARVHTDLFPLFYTLAYQAHETGLPLMRHPYLLYPDDPNAAKQELEYFLGDSMLVAPVVTLGDRQRPVYLPEGKWVDFWDGQVFEGGKDATVKAPLDTIPVFIKAGAIIPTLLQPLQTLGTNGTADAVHLLDGGLKLKIYGPFSDLQTNVFKLFDNTNISYIKQANNMEITIDGNGNSRPYQIEVSAPSEPVEVSAEGNSNQSLNKLAEPIAKVDGNTTGWWYDAAQKQVVAVLKGSKVVLHLNFS